MSRAAAELDFTVRAQVESARSMAHPQDRQGVSRRNLLKGAAGQAVQNMNVMYGWNEEEGLS